MKKPFQAFSYQVQNASDGTLDVHIDGLVLDASTQQIMKDWFGDDTSVSYKSFRNQVEAANPKTVNVYINSGGGMVTDAMAIHDLLVSLDKKGVKVNTIGRGLVASAATFILMAGGKNSSMSENSWFMIHNVSGGVYGDVNMIESYATSTRKFNDQIVGNYSKATGLSETVISNMMDKETWMTAQEAKDKGFIKNVDGAAEFSNKISADNWPFENTQILNQYNAAVKDPVSPNHSFFTDLKSEFMKFFDQMKASITTAKTDKKNENIPNRDEILAMVESVLTPLVNKIDEHVTATEKKDPVETPEQKKAREDAAAEEVKKNKVETPEEKKTREDAAAAEAAKTNKVDPEVKKLRDELEALRLSVANDKSKPAGEAKIKEDALVSKVKISYEDD